PGTGSELRHPLGVTIVGGLILSQLLTLFTTPVIYLYFDRLARAVRQRLGTAFNPEGAVRRAACEPVEPVYRAAGRDDAADDRPRARGPLRVFQIAGGAAAADRFPDDFGVRADARGEPGHDGDNRRDAARTPSRGYRRRDRDDLSEHGRLDPYHPAICARPQHRRRGARCSGRDRRLPRRSADEPALEPDLSQGQPGRRADSCPVADLRYPHARPGV